VLEQEPSPPAGRWPGLCCRACGHVTTSAATTFRQGQERGPTPGSAGEKALGDETPPHSHPAGPKNGNRQAASLEARRGVGADGLGKATAEASAALATAEPGFQPVRGLRRPCESQEAKSDVRENEAELFSV